MSQETEQKLKEFFTACQIELQTSFHQSLRSIDPLVAEAEASLGDLSFCVGSVFASVLFELIREPEELKINDEQAELCTSLIEPFLTGFSEKLALLAAEDPENLQVINQ